MIQEIYQQIKQYPLVTIALVMANLLVFALMMQSGVDFLQPSSYDFLTWGANFNPYTLDGEWWRIFSSLFVHGSYAHLAFNTYGLIFLGLQFESYLGKIEYLVAYLLSGVAGCLASLWWNYFTVSVGASGAIFGIYGFLIIVAIIEQQKSQKAFFSILLNFVIFIGINLFVGELVNADHAGHFGGLFAGMFMALFRELRSFKIAIFKPYIDQALVFGIIFTILFFTLSRNQVHYYQTFQLVKKTEDKAREIATADYRTDELYAKNLHNILPLWDSARNQAIADTLHHYPLEIELDRMILTDYCSLRKEGVIQRINLIEKESYIYWDSIEVVSENLGQLSPIRNYVDHREKPQPPSEPKAAEPQPTLYPIKEYYNDNWDVTDLAFEASYYREGTQDSLGRWQGRIRDYYISGAIQMKGTYKDDLKDGVFLYYFEDSTYDAAGVYEEEFNVGRWEYFHRNGQLKSKVYYKEKTVMLNAWDEEGNQTVTEGNGFMVEKYPNGIIESKGEYKDGFKDGIWYGYTDDGKPFFKEFYEENILIEGESYSKSGDKFFYDRYTQFPTPEGGYDLFYAYVRGNKVYPLKAKDENISGTVTLLFTVNADGSISDVRFRKKLEQSCDEEAKRLLFEGPQWLPAKEYGQTPFKTDAVIDISFP